MFESGMILLTNDYYLQSFYITIYSGIYSIFPLTSGSSYTKFSREPIE
jgi:hypothetical protein